MIPLTALDGWWFVWTVLATNDQNRLKLENDWISDNTALWERGVMTWMNVIIYFIECNNSFDGSRGMVIRSITSSKNRPESVWIIIRVDGIDRVSPLKCSDWFPTRNLEKFPYSNLISSQHRCIAWNDPLDWRELVSHIWCRSISSLISSSLIYLNRRTIDR